MGNGLVAISRMMATLNGQYIPANAMVGSRGWFKVTIKKGQEIELVPNVCVWAKEADDGRD